MQNVRLEITIERPTEDDPTGYIGLTAHSLKPELGESHIRQEDGADGTCTPETIGRVIADVLSYYEHGHKSHTGRMAPSGRSRRR